MLFIIIRCLHYFANAKVVKLFHNYFGHKILYTNNDPIITTRSLNNKKRIRKNTFLHHLFAFHVFTVYALLPTSLPRR